LHKGNFLTSSPLFRQAASKFVNNWNRTFVFFGDKIWAYRVRTDRPGLTLEVSSINYQIRVARSLKIKPKWQPCIVYFNLCRQKSPKISSDFATSNLVLRDKIELSKFELWHRHDCYQLTSIFRLFLIIKIIINISDNEHFYWIFEK